MKLQLLISLSLMLQACTNEQLYNAIQENRRQECGKLPQPQYEECLQEYDLPYEEYERERREIEREQR